MRVTVAPNPVAGRTLAELEDHFATGRRLAALMSADPRLRGTVLDVGCGARGPTIDYYHDLYRLPAVLDGVDPMPGVENNPWLDRAWRGEFDTAPIPSDHYDAIITINVVEHVANPETFLAQAFRVLKPGGVMYALTPNALHPFAASVRIIQALGLKSRMVQGQAEWNDYPAYYRLNSRGAVRRFGEKTGFAAAEFFHVPNMQWKQYFPKYLHFLPWIYDRTLGCNIPVLFLTLFWKLEKPGQWAGLQTAPSSAPAQRPKVLAASA